MPKPPQDIYARHLFSHRGYPLWCPEPSQQLLAYRRDGLRIGDVGVVIPEDGCFDVFFNVCLPADHSFHRATGVPDNFKPITLNDMDVRTTVNAENSGCILKNSSVRSIRAAPSGREYEFTLSSSEGALLILPEGAQRHRLHNHRRFLELAIQHGADWYRFVEEKVGQIINNDSLYLVTGLYKTTSWPLAAFEETTGTAEYPAQFRVAPPGADNITATSACDTTRDLNWHAGPCNKYKLANQAVFICGFKIALQTGMFGKRWINTKADSPSTRPNPASFSSVVPGDSTLAYIFGGISARLSGGSGAQDEVTVDSMLDEARNEIQDSGALAVGEHVVIHQVPGASEAFHPSDIINRYLLNKEPSASIAITHDDVWITMLEGNLLQPEDFMQEGRLEALVSQRFGTISEGGAVYLQSQSGSGTPEPDRLDEIIMGGRTDREDSSAMDIDAEPAELQHTDPIDTFDSKLTTGYQTAAIAGTSTTNDNDCHCLWLVDGAPCNKILRGFDSFMVHLDRDHVTKESMAPELVCRWSTDKGPCGRMRDKDGFKRHMETHHFHRVFVCTECNMPFSRLNNLLTHQERKHDMHGGLKESTWSETVQPLAEVEALRRSSASLWPLWNDRCHSTTNSEPGTSEDNWLDSSGVVQRLDYKDPGGNVIGTELAKLPDTTTPGWQPFNLLPGFFSLYSRDHTTGADPPTAGVSATTTIGDCCHCLWATRGVVCNEFFYSFNTLMFHLGHAHDVRGHAIREVVCQWCTDGAICGEVLLKESVRRHIGTRHIHRVVGVCNACGKSFTRGDSLRLHQKRAHGVRDSILTDEL